jgi:hypothetical protein
MRASRSELRKFGLLVGGIFVAIAGYKLVRHRAGPATELAGLAGAILVVAGGAAPSLLGPLHTAWMRVGAVLGWINTRILLGAIFFLVLTPTSLLMRLFGRDPLQRRRLDINQSYWHEHADAQDPARYRRQF